MSATTCGEGPPLQFFRSSPAPCPYLPGRIERKLFARLAPNDSPVINTRLSRGGFRRSHDIIYKPACPGCAACVAVRIPVARFTPSPSLARVARRGRTLTTSFCLPQASRDDYALFMRYEQERHPDSDMARMSYDDYAAMITEGYAETSLLTLALPPCPPSPSDSADPSGSTENRVGVMLVDKLADGWSAVYAFYEVAPARPDVPSGLGSLLILRLIEAARAEGLPYVYLGYWVGQSRKMDYKARFRPLEMLGPEGWVPFREDGLREDGVSDGGIT